MALSHLKPSARRAARVRLRLKKLGGGRPRLSVFRSAKNIYAQVIDDCRGVTLAAASSVAIKDGDKALYGGSVKGAVAVGKKIAEEAKAKGIGLAAFDRGHYKYHGRVKALADAAREGGLKF